MYRLASWAVPHDPVKDIRIRRQSVVVGWLEADFPLPQFEPARRCAQDALSRDPIPHPRVLALACAETAWGQGVSGSNRTGGAVRPVVPSARLCPWPVTGRQRLWPFVSVRPLGGPDGLHMVSPSLPVDLRRAVFLCCAPLFSGKLWRML